MTEAYRFGLPMRDWQRECAEVRARFFVMALHRRAGKTEIALKKLLDSAVKNHLDLPMYFYVAPYLKQAKLIAWTRLKQMVAPLVPHGLFEVNESELFVRYTPNEALIRIFGADNPDAMRGVRLDGAVIDEVAQTKLEVWDEILQPALSDRLGWAWFIGTPKGLNLFSQLYFQAHDDPDWAHARYTVYDTQAIHPDEVNRLKRNMSEAAWAREYLCDFSASGDDQLISLSDVEVAAKRELKDDQFSFSAKVIGVDPARFGDDRSVIFKRQGLQALEPQVFRGIDNMDLAARVAKVIEDWRPDAVFCDAGNGSGVIDRLRQLGHDVIEVHFGGKASANKYLNKRAEMWDGVREWLSSGASIPDNIALKQDLAAPIYWFDAAGRFVLEPKDDIKKRGLPSPDLGDALAVTFAFPVAPKGFHVPGLSGRRAQSYDPYSVLR